MESALYAALLWLPSLANATYSFQYVWRTVKIRSLANVWSDFYNYLKCFKTLMCYLHEWGEIILFLYLRSRTLSVVKGGLIPNILDKGQNDVQYDQKIVASNCAQILPNRKLRIIL